MPVFLPIRINKSTKVQQLEHFHATNKLDKVGLKPTKPATPIVPVAK